MNNKNKFLLLIPLLTGLLLPVMTFVLYIFGYSVTLLSYSVFSVVSALIFIISALLIPKKKISCKALAFLPVISLANLAVYVFKSRSAVVLVSMAVCFVCAAVIAEKACTSSKTKILSVLTSVALSVPVLIFFIAVVAFSGFGVNNVVDKIHSPDKTYYAEIVDSDQGALGGDTVVYVHKNSKLNLIFLTISKTPQRVYLGEWREYETMQIEWKNEECLLIDSKEYYIE